MINCRTGLSLVLAVALAACLCEASVRDLRNKYRNMMSPEASYIPGAHGGSAAAAASASSAGVSSSVAANAAAAGYGRMPAPHFAGHQQPHYAHHHQQQPQHHHMPQYYQPQVPPQYVQAPPAYRPQPAQYAPAMQSYYGAEGGLIEEMASPYGQQHQMPYGGHQAAAAAASAASYAKPQPMAYQYAQPQKHHRVHPQRFHQEPQHFVQSGRMPPTAAYQQGGAATSSAAAAIGGGAAAASAAAGGHSMGAGRSAAATGAAGAAAAGSAAAASAVSNHYVAPVEHDRRTVDEEVMSEHFNEPESVQHYEAQAGTFANGGAGGNYEQGSYVRDTESIENHEDGREDGDHYYQAQSYGKTKDVNNHVAYNNDDEDIVHTPNMFRKKKSNTNFVSNFNKQHRETGSGVTAHDKHSASYNKNSKKLKENVDQRYSKGSEGLVQTKAFDSHTDIDDEDEEAMDTRGLGNFVGVDGVLHGRRAQPNNPAAAAAAAASASFQSGR